MYLEHRHSLTQFLIFLLILLLSPRLPPLSPVKFVTGLLQHLLIYTAKQTEAEKTEVFFVMKQENSRVLGTNLGLSTVTSKVRGSTHLNARPSLWSRRGT